MKKIIAVCLVMAILVNMYLLQVTATDDEAGAVHANIENSEGLVETLAGTEGATELEVEESSTPKVEESSTPKVEESSTPKVEELSTPKVEEPSIPKVEEASTSADKGIVVPKDEVIVSTSDKLSVSQSQSVANQSLDCESVIKTSTLEKMTTNSAIGEEGISIGDGNSAITNEPEPITDEVSSTFTGYTIDSDGVIIEVSAAVVDENGAVVIPKEVNDITVTAIGAGVFVNMVNIKQITFEEGSSIEKIGEQAFFRCTGLTSITFPESLKTIEKRAFYYCTSLERIDIPANVEMVGEECFSSCNMMGNATFEQGDKIVTIGDGAFMDCSSLSVIAINRPIEKIGNMVFQNCFSLTSFDIPANVTSIGNYSFAGAGIVTIDLDGIRKIGGGAFAGAALITIEIPNSITDLGVDLLGDADFPSEGSVFQGCPSLVNVTFESGCQLTEIKNSTFSWCTSLATIELPSGIETIESAAFDHCGLTSIAMPDTVKTIESRAFAENEHLTSMMIEKTSTLQTIDNEVFDGCVELQNILIPASVRTIGERVFKRCDSLEKIEIDNNYGEIEIGSWGAYGSTLIVYKSTIIEYKDDATGTEISDIEYMWNILSDEAGNCTIGLNYYGGTATDLTLDTRTIDGTTYTVVAILESAFYGNDTIRNLEIADTVTEIGEEAFYQCINLESVNTTSVAGSQLESIGEEAFYGCSSLGSINLTEGSAFTSIGSYAFYECKSLDNVILSDSIINLETYAFRGCENLSKIEVPRKITTLSESVFSGCISLEEVILHNGLEELEQGAFYNCYSIVSIEIPSTVLSIGEHAFAMWKSSELENVTFEEGSKLKVIENGAFQDCNSLVTISIPSTIERIGPESDLTIYVFDGCTNLETIFVDKAYRSLTKYPWAARNETNIIWNTAIGYDEDKKIYYTFDEMDNAIIEECDYIWNIIDEHNIELTYYRGDEKSVVLEETVEVDGVSYTLKAISERAFYKNPILESVTIPDSVEIIGEEAFCGCTSLEVIDVPSAVTKIADSTFSGCISLVAVTGLDNVTIIGDAAFQKCERLKEIDLSEDLISIGRSSFSNCYNLTTVDLAVLNKLETIGEYAFYMCTNLEKVEIPESVTELGNYAFAYCNVLKTAVIKGDIKNIGNRLFYQCKQLESVIVEKFVENIYSEAFCGCTNLKIVELQDGVCTLWDSVFQDCSSLETITLDFKTIKEEWWETNGSIDEDVFSGCSTLSKVWINGYVESIGGCAFENCINLELVEFEILDQEITYGDIWEDQRVFVNCTSLKKITIPATKESRNDWVVVMNDTFAECSNLMRIEIYDVRDTNLYSGAPWGANENANVIYLLSDVVVNTDSITRTEVNYERQVNLSAYVYKGLVSAAYYPDITSTKEASYDFAESSEFTFDGDTIDAHNIAKPTWTSISKYEDIFTTKANGTYVFEFAHSLDAGSDKTTLYTVVIDDIGIPTITASDGYVYVKDKDNVDTEEELLQVLLASAADESGASASDENSVVDLTVNDLENVLAWIQAAEEGDTTEITLTATQSVYNKTATKTVTFTVLDDLEWSIPIVDSEGLDTGKSVVVSKADTVIVDPIDMSTVEGISDTGQWGGETLIVDKTTLTEVILHRPEAPDYHEFSHWDITVVYDEPNPDTATVYATAVFDYIMQIPNVGVNNDDSYMQLLLIFSAFAGTGLYFARRKMRRRVSA